MGLRKLDNTNSWKVNSNPIYIPDADISVEFNSLASEDSGRDESGVMHITWIRTNIRKMVIKYALMTEEELNYMVELVQGKEYTFTFVDVGGVHTMEAYTSTVTATLYTTFNGINIYKDVSFSVIER